MGAGLSPVRLRTIPVARPSTPIMAARCIPQAPSVVPRAPQATPSSGSPGITAQGPSTIETIHTPVPCPSSCHCPTPHPKGTHCGLHSEWPQFMVALGSLLKAPPLGGSYVIFWGVSGARRAIKMFICSFCLFSVYEWCVFLRLWVSIGVHASLCTYAPTSNPPCLVRPFIVLLQYVHSRWVGGGGR